MNNFIFKEKFEKVLMCQSGLAADELKPELRFIEDLGLDSLDLTELIIEFEKEFKISIPDEEVEKIKTAGDVEDYLRKVLEIE